MNMHMISRSDREIPNSGLENSSNSNSESSYKTDSSLSRLPMYHSPIKATNVQTFAKRVRTHKCRIRPVTAVIAEPFWQGQRGSNSSRDRRTCRALWQVLLDSGSDGDLLFIRKGSKKESVPYLKRRETQIWHTSNGVFTTDSRAQIELTLPEYAGSRRMNIEPDIVQYDEQSPNPMFDLIIGTETMQNWGVVLDFETKMVKIDGTSLPMRDIKTLQDRDFCLQAIANSYPSYISRYEPHAM